MMEWVALIPARRNIMKVRFKGGKLGGYGFGATPATFRTDNHVVKRLIENSSYFKSGKIELLSYVPDDDEPAEGTAEMRDGFGMTEMWQQAPGALVFTKGER